MINELLLEVVGSVAPVLLQVHAQIACNDHSATIGHEACLIHFPHQGVDDRHPCHSPLPTFNCLGLGLPVVVGAIVNTIAREHFVSVIHAPKPIEVAPKKFIDVHLRRGVSCFLLLKLFDLPVDLAARDASIGQPRR